MNAPYAPWRESSEVHVWVDASVRASGAVLGLVMRDHALRQTRTHRQEAPRPDLHAELQAIVWACTVCRDEGLLDRPVWIYSDCRGSVLGIQKFLVGKWIDPKKAAYLEPYKTELAAVHLHWIHRTFNRAHPLVKP